MIPTQIDDPLKSGATLITATKRLSRELINQFDRQQLASGIMAWNSADILPWDSWLKRCWEQLPRTLENLPLVLSDAQLHGMWQQIIADDIRVNEEKTEPLWNTHSSARAGIHALRLMRVWKINRERIASSSHVDHRCFVRWLDNFTKQCEQRCWIDSYQLAGQLTRFAEHLSNTPVYLIGFDLITPQQQRLIEAMQNVGIATEVIGSKHSTNPPHSYAAFKDESSQWMAAGQWAREILRSNPNKRIAIVAPDLTRSRHAIEYALKQTLSPHDLLHPGDNSILPFHLSLGSRLSNYPVVHHGLMLLNTLCERQVDINAVSQMILSPYIKGAESELLARSKLDLKLRQELPYKCSLNKFVDQFNWLTNDSGDQHCPVFGAILDRAVTIVNDESSLSSFNDWSAFFSALLNTLGWPGERPLGSDEYQATEAFHGEINRLGDQDLIYGPVSRATALGWLNRRVTAQVFQVEANNEPVQVMGIDETAGLEFDGIWFGGLIESDWPPGSRPCPFIPLDVQRGIGFIGATAEATSNFAHQQQQRLLASAEEVILSSHLYDDDIALESSPLVADYTANEILNLTIPSTVAAQFNQNRPTLETVNDSKGPPLDTGIEGSGGTALIQAQAQCPRGAYARFRLGATQISTNEQGLDPMERGSMLHLALEMAWGEIVNSRRLQNMDQTALEVLLDHCVNFAGKRFKVRSGCGDAFFHSQQRWLTTTLMEWFTLEKKRNEPFEVISREQKSTLNLEGLRLQFKIDRIDQLENGSLVLIDYKSGRNSVISEWAKERLTAPQLPLYMISQGLPVEAVAFAQVKSGSCCFIGVSDQQAFGTDIGGGFRVSALSRHRSLKHVFSNWEEMHGAWFQALGIVAKEFLSGDACIDPEGNGLCRYCETPSFCRSGDHISHQLED